MTIESITKQIEKLFTMIRKPIMKLPAILVYCSCMKRPGLSSIISLANVIAANAKAGIPTGLNDDGSPNLLNIYAKNIIDEVFRAMREDMQVQTAIQPGEMKIVGTAGDRPVTATNVTFTSTIGTAK